MVASIIGIMGVQLAETGTKQLPSQGALVGEPPAVQLDFATRRAHFLARLRGKKTLYKRYFDSPLRYAGGKSLAVGFVIERLPNNIRRLISPFFGGGSVEIACARELGLAVIGADVFDLLSNYWDAQLNAPEELYRALEAFEPTRATFAVVKERLRQHWRDGRLLDPIDCAAHYYFNSNTSYGPHFLGWPSSVYLQEKRYRAMIEKVRRFRAPTLEVRCAPFQETIAAYPDDVLYCDPPYYLDDGKTFVGMYPHRNFPIHHKGFEHERLRDLLLAHRGGFILSYNDCKTIRDWYSDCHQSSPEWQYTFGQGDTRIGANRADSGDYVKRSHELLIWKLGSDD